MTFLLGYWKRENSHDPEQKVIFVPVSPCVAATDPDNRA